MVAALLQFLDNPGEVHWEAVKRILHYLSETKDFVLTYGDKRHDLIGYTDADGAMQEYRHAISGHAFLIDSRVCYRQDGNPLSRAGHVH